jgi:hypothetical protein
MQRTRRFLNSSNTYRVVFWFIVLAGITFIIMSHPMMKLRFDIWQHLGSIDDLVVNPMADIPKANWYATWAFVFRALGVHEIRTYAVIIHRTQFLLSCFIVYLSSAYLFPALLLKNEQDSEDSQNLKQWTSSFALSSMLVWLTVIGTVSTFQQAWIMWYSVNYQVTLPFLFLAIGLFINVVVVKQSPLAIYTKMACSFILLLLVFLFHAAELFYLFVYLASVLVVFAKRKNKKNILICMLVIVPISWIASKFYMGRVPEIISLIQMGQSTKISNLIHEYGKYNVNGGNRFDANWNALYAICVACALPILIINHTGKALLNTKVLYIALASLAYCFIPTFELSSGITSLFYPADILNRLYFASLLFILPSLLVYLILNRSTKFKHPIYLLIIVLMLMLMTSFYSRYINNAGTYFQNINSIRNSLKPSKVGINLPEAEIESIGRQIQAAEKTYGVDGVHFCASYDKAHIVWFIYRQKNMRFYRNGMTYGLDQCIDDSRSAKKHLIVIE